MLHLGMIDPEHDGWKNQTNQTEAEGKLAVFPRLLGHRERVARIVHRLEPHKCSDNINMICNTKAT